VHMYYFGNWLIKLVTLGFYPCGMFASMFPWLGLVDSSFGNFLQFMRLGCLVALNGVTLGHMWATLVENESNAIVSGICLMQACVMGSGHFMSSQSNIFTKILSTYSPNKYTAELLLRRLMNTTSSLDFISNFLKLNQGADCCEAFLIYQALCFLFIGWLVAWYKSVYIY
jgi:hypothetical protein